MVKSAFKFELDEPVKLECSDEAGVVIARAEYVNSENSYLVRYRAGDGRATEVWWSESAMAPKAS